MRIFRPLSLIALASTAAASQAVVLNFTSRTAWEAATTYDTIGFSDLPNNTKLTSQYASQGVSFDGTDTVIETNVYQDGHGVYGNGTIVISFASSLAAFATIFPGGVKYSLYQGADLVGVSDEFGGVGRNFFGGVTSTVAFDRVVIEDFGDRQAFIDALEFGNARTTSVPGPLAALPFALMALKRRRKA